MHKVQETALVQRSLSAMSARYQALADYFLVNGQ